MTEHKKIEMLTPYKDESIEKFVWKIGDKLDMMDDKVQSKVNGKWYDLPKHSEGIIWKMING